MLATLLLLSFRFEKAKVLGLILHSCDIAHPAKRYKEEAAPPRIIMKNFRSEKEVAKNEKDRMTENHKSRIEQVRIKVENNCEIQKERQEKKATECAR